MKPAKNLSRNVLKKECPGGVSLYFIAPAWGSVVLGHARSFGLWSDRWIAHDENGNAIADFNSDWVFGWVIHSAPAAPAAQSNPHGHSH